MGTQWKYVGRGVVLGIAMGAVIGGSLWAGPLEPPTGAVSNGTPSSTIRPLDEVNGAWSRTLPCESSETCERFALVLNDTGILDKETGLLWERAPDTDVRNWKVALNHCYFRELGGRRGWRLPTFEELASLLDISGSTNGLPAGHPFTNVRTEDYWSATTSVTDSTRARLVHFENGSSAFLPAFDKETVGDTYAWCVRGGDAAQNPQ